ncbi:MAG TPA: thioredoxin family protein [Polyangiaceae bacterium]|nr:thioredoxin family protein [Polyangiaceae bacterium]
MTRARFASLAALLLLACTRANSEPGARPIAGPAGSTTGAAASVPAEGAGKSAPAGDVATTKSPAAPSGAPEELPPLPFIEDDFGAARAEATRRNLPLFVDVWANWCHSCMSLKEVVFPDPRLRALRDRFVFLSLDSENEKNAPFFHEFPNRSLPTLWVFSPRGDRPLLKWIGAATAEELVSLLGSVEGGAPELGEAARLFVEANRESAAAHSDRAIALYRKALSAGSSGWVDRDRAVEALTMRYAETARARECVELALAEAPRMAAGTPRVNVVSNGLTAASRLPDSAKSRAAFATLRDLAKRIAEDPSEPILVDDRSGLYESLVGIYGSSDPKEARRLATAWADMLERAAAADRTPEARRARDPHRLEAYLALGEPDRAIPMLERSEREAPDDYNPKARLARAWFAKGDVQRAAAYLERAIPLCPGPRRLRLYLFEADVMMAKKDRAGARKALEEALAFARNAHVSHEYDALVASIRTRLSGLR